MGKSNNRATERRSDEVTKGSNGSPHPSPLPRGEGEAAPVSAAVAKAAAGRTVAIEVPVAAEVEGNPNTAWAEDLRVRLSPRERRALQHVYQACHGQTLVGKGAPGLTVRTEVNAVRMILEKIADGLGL